MNKIHKIVWNSFKHQWIVVSELVNQGKTKSTQLLLTSILISFPTYALADCMPGSNSNNCMINATITENASNKEYDGIENIDVVSVSDGGEAIFDFPSSSHEMHLTSHGSGNVITMNGGSIAFDNEEAEEYRGVILKAQDDGNVIKINDGKISFNNTVADLTANKGKVIAMDGGEIKFDKNAYLRSENIGKVIEMNGGKISFADKADLNAEEGKVIEMNDGQILFDSESSLTVNDGNVIEINGGEVTFNENSDLSTRHGNGISMSGGTINYNSGNHSVSTGGGGAAIKLDNGTINAHNDASYLSVTSNDTGNALEIHGGKASLGESTMYARDSGNAISVSGGELILNSETNIYADDGTGILLSGGLITVGKDSEVYMDPDNIPIDITGGELNIKGKIDIEGGQKGIVLNGGTLSNEGMINIGGENDAIAAIESSVTSGNTAVFNNTGEITGDNFKDIIVHNGTGTLKVNNTSTGILANNKGNLMATTSTGTIEVSNSAKLTGTMDAGTKGTINLNNNVSGIWESTGNSKLSNVTNAGLIQFMHPISGSDPDEFHTLNITGNYKGENGTVKMHTVWNEPLSDTIGENFKSDILKIDGSASGITTIIPVSTVDGTENIIDGDIKQVDTILNSGSVVYVGKKGADVAFKGKAKTTGASEVQIKKRSSTEGDEYYWTTDLSEEDGGSHKLVPIYANVVAGYTLMPRVNIEQGFTSIANLAERRGDVSCEDCSNDKDRYTWARTFGKNQKQDGKQRLNLDTDIYGFQVGHDFSVKQFDDNSKNLLGAYISYSRANTDFSDQYHADNGIISKDKRTGKGTSDNISLGLTNTYLSGSGRYLDLVGQLSYLHNKYTARNSDNPDSQDGWGVALSAEIGQFVPFSSSDWALEPQAQLVYQYLNLDSFTDGIRYVNQNNQDGLRGRIGLKLSYNPTSKAGQRKSVYAISNIWHDFIKPDSVNIGHDRIHENFNSTWGEIGVGVQLPLAQNSKIYGDIRYEYDFGGSKNQSFNGNIGFKLNW